ncbi:glycosyltransferase [Daejeonia sp. YH14]|uniref:glycosyltransferase n=1 Tax=Daejeonia sp. YH14 TaxID=3439042 RepID=UPI003F49095D
MNFNILKAKQKAKTQARNFIKENNIQAQNLVYDNYLQKYSLKYLPQISNENYDVAISFLTPHYVVAQKVNAKKKIAWIHTDYSFFEFDRESEIQMWAAYDNIASISEDCTKGFVKQFPELSSKMVEIENILDPGFVREKADEFSVNNEMPKIPGEYNLLSVGRFTHAKNFDNIPEITKILVEKGIALKWYLIGYGGEEQLIRQKIEEFQMKAQVIILGKKDNPYPYMKACDYYIQPSRFEGKAVTVREAQMLAKPVVIANFATAKSQLNNGFDGMIVPMDNEGIAQGIEQLIKNRQKTTELIENCKQSDYGNLNEVQKIDQLID